MKLTTVIFIDLNNIVEIHIVLKFKVDLLIFHQVTVKNKGGRIFLEQSVHMYHFPSFRLNLVSGY